MRDNILDIVRSLYPFDYSVTSEDSLKSSKVYKKYLKFKVHYFKPGLSINEWKIPFAQKVLKAEIYYNNKLILDGKKNKLTVITNCKSFSGELNYNELIKHIYYSEELNNAIPYGWTGLYNHKKEWGFCVTKNFFKKLKKNGKYKINLKIHTLKKCPMQVLEYTIRGKSNKTILLNGHNCHPYQANDDISGCSVGISIMKSLNKIKNLNYSYTLLIAPEIYGPLFWLKKIKNKAKNIIGCIQLKSVGNNNNLKFQKTFNGNTDLDKVFLNLFKNDKKVEIFNFRERHGNDEIVFESPGYNIPTITLTRVPFKEYHTDLDTPKIVKNDMLNKTKKITFNAISILENNYLLKNKKKGLVCLSSPNYNLYIAPKQPGIIKANEIIQQNIEWNLLMNSLPLNIDRKKSFLDIYLKYSLNIEDLLKYILKWKNKKLISLSLKKDLI